MGSYINIGLASKKSLINESVMELFAKLNNFVFQKVHLPRNNDYNLWVSLTGNDCSLKEAFDYCLKYEMCYFVGDFVLNNIQLHNVEFAVEKSFDDIVCLIVKIPYREIYDNIDDFEYNVIELLKKTNGFTFAFCDSEAHLGDDKYSIYVQYLDEPKFTYGNWKVDGLSER